MEASTSGTLNISPTSSSVQKCEKCPDKFISNDKLVLHYVMNHKYHICEICTTVTPNYDDMKVHEMESHLPIKCEICFYDITDKIDDLRIHRENQHKLYTCYFCPITLNNSLELNFHLKRKHFVLIEFNINNGLVKDFTLSKWAYMCLLCGKQREKNGLVGHYRGFHRIATPTIAKILLQQNVMLSVSGTINSNEQTEAEDLGGHVHEHLKNVESINHEGRVQQHCDTNNLDNNIIEYNFNNDINPNPNQSAIHYNNFNNTQQTTSNIINNKINETNNSDSSIIYNNNNIVQSTTNQILESILNNEFIKPNERITTNTNEINATRNEINATTNENTTSPMLLSILSTSSKNYGANNEQLKNINNELVNHSEEIVVNAEIKSEQFSCSDDDSSDEDFDGGDTIKKGSSTNDKTCEDYDDIEAEVDPNDIECVLTETSDVESESESDNPHPMEIYNMATQQTPNPPNDEVAVKTEPFDENGELTTNVPKKLGNYIVLNNLVICNKIGLNQMEHFPCGFRCEVCHGYFDSREGLRELLRHMRTLHGIKSNVDTRNLNSMFDNFGRIKITSYPEYSGPIHVCPFCSLRASSKRFIRQHALAFHGNTWLLDEPSGPLSYSCTHCKICFWYMHERDQHEKSQHPDQSIYRCHICSQPFLRKVLVNEHLRVSHPESGLHKCVSYKCKSCEILVPDYSNLETHIKLYHTTNTIYRCTHCDLGLKNMKSLRHHVKTQHINETQDYECDICGKVTHSKRSLNSHKRLKHDTVHRVGFKCRLCDQIFNNKDERKVHYGDAHADESPFMCNVCNKGFASKSGLYGHKIVHKVAENFFKCQFCGKEFTRRDSFNEHLLIHMGPRHKCPHCTKDFVQRSNLVRHIRIHTGEKPYKCTHCDKTFSDKGACNSHIRVHTGEEHSACPFCGQTFSKKQKLKYHIRKHTGEGLLECDVCSKTFTNSYSLKDHKLTHIRAAENFTCTDCGSAFTENRYLNRHRAVAHSNVPCFPCPFCEKIFSHQPRLRTHILIHASIKYLKCARCDEQFDARSKLHDHLAEDHSISVNHEHYHQSFISLEPEDVGLIIPKFTEEEILSLNNQERDDRLREYFNDVIEGKINLGTQFQFKLIQRDRRPKDPQKKDLIKKLKQQQSSQKGAQKKPATKREPSTTPTKPKERCTIYNLRENKSKLVLSDSDYEMDDEEDLELESEDPFISMAAQSHHTDDTDDDDDEDDGSMSFSEPAAAFVEAEIQDSDDNLDD